MKTNHEAHDVIVRRHSDGTANANNECDGSQKTYMRTLTEMMERRVEVRRRGHKTEGSAKQLKRKRGRKIQKTTTHATAIKNEKKLSDVNGGKR